MSGDLIIENLVPNLVPWWDTILIIGQLIGFILVAVGIRSFVAGGRQQPSVKGAVLSIVAGICMVNVIAILNIMAESILAKSSETGLTYSPPAGSSPEGLYIQFGVYVVMLVGLAGVINGLILLKRSAEDGRLVGSAITHIVGGTLGVNIVEFLHLLGASMGPSVEGAISSIFG